MVRLAIVLLLLLLVVPAFATQRHVTATSTTRSGNALTEETAWPLSYALGDSGGVIQAGDTIWVHGGQYDSQADEYFKLTKSGTSGSPIIFRNHNDERAIINGNSRPAGNTICWDASASYVWFWGLEMCNDSVSNRQSASDDGNGPDVDMSWGINSIGSSPGNGVKFINCIFHDVKSQGLWKAAKNVEVYGSLFYNIGWQKLTRSSGYPIYMQSQGGQKAILNNIFEVSFSTYVHAYGSDDVSLDSIIIRNNLFNTDEIGWGCLVGGLGHQDSLTATGWLHADTVSSNWAYKPYDVVSNVALTLGYNVSGPLNSEMSNNLSTSFYHPIDCYRDSFTTITGNVVYGPHSVSDFDTTGHPGNVFYTDGPPESGDTSRCIPNVYDSRLANIHIFNWGEDDSITVGVSSAYSNGDTVTLYNAANYFGDPTYTAVVAGGNIVVPMLSARWTRAQPLGWVNGEDSYDWPGGPFPSRGAFVAIQTSNAPSEEQDPPTVSTDSSNTVTFTGAKVYGTVNPEGAATNYQFEYGTTTAYGSTTTLTSAGSGSGDSSVSATLSGLSEATKYYFRITATNEGGTSNGAADSLTTAGITVTGSLSAFSAAKNAYSAGQSYLLSATGLSANVIITPPSGFQVSSDSTTWQSADTVNHSGGTITSTKVYIRYAPTAWGSASGNVANASTSATTQNVSVSGLCARNPNIPAGVRRVIRKS